MEIELFHYQFMRQRSRDKEMRNRECASKRKPECNEMWGNRPRNRLRFLWATDARKYKLAGFQLSWHDVVLRGNIFTPSFRSQLHLARNLLQPTDFDSRCCWTPDGMPLCQSSRCRHAAGNISAYNNFCMSSRLNSQSRRILDRRPGPIVSPEWTGTTVVRPSACRRK